MAEMPEGFEPVHPEGFEPVAGWAPLQNNTPAQPINPSPAAFQRRVDQGEAIRQHVAELSAQRGKIDPDVTKQFKSAWDRIAGGFSDSHADDWWTRMLAVPKMALGAVDMLSLPYSVPVGKVDEALASTGAFKPGDFETAMAGVMIKSRGKNPFGGDHPDKPSPITDAGGGDQSVLRSGPDGEITARVTGKYPPTQEDFANVAHNVTGGADKEHLQKVYDKLQTYWNVDGLHPAEVAERAAQSPVLAHDLSAAKSPPVTLPARPSPQYLQELADHFQRLKGAHTADQAEMLNRLADMPASIKDGAVQEAWYRYGEGDPNHGMTPEEGKLYNEIMGPLKEEERQLWEEAKKTDLDVETLNPNYMHRVVKGKTPEIDRLAGQGGQGDNPIYNGPGLLKRDTGSLHERKYYAIENAAGERRTVKVSNGEMSFLHDAGSNGGPPLTFKAEADNPLIPGAQVEIDGQKWTLKQALTDEIERDTNTRYYKNALINTIDNILRLRSVNRAVYTIQQIRTSDEWAKYASSAFGKTPMNDGWISPQMPLFKNDRMDPKLAHVIDDFYGKAPVDGLENALERINRFAVGSLFWTPVPHAHNAGVHWVGARSWDWVTPAGLRSVTMDSMEALRQVVTQGPKYQQLLREGSGLMYGGVANRDFYAQLLEKAGMEFQKQDPKEFSAIAKIVGKTAYELGDWVFKKSARVLWAASDVFMMQRVLELEGKGMTTRQAIAEAERFIPNYRVPSEFSWIPGQDNGRYAQQLYTNPKAFMFSRYHYGVLKGLANLASDLAVGDAKHRWDAIGHIMALGTLSMIVYPAVSAGLQKLTGEDNLKVPAAGPLRLLSPVINGAVNATSSLWPEWVKKYYNNDTDLMQSLSNLAPFSPAIKMGVENLQNRYMFSGRPVHEPADMRDALQGDVGAGMRVGLGHAEQGVQTLIEPYNIFNDAWRTGKSIPGLMIEHALGLQDRTEDQERAKERAFRYQKREQRGRIRKPAGMIESVGD